VPGRLPAAELAKTTPQNPVYHAEGDVWTHTMMVVVLLAMPDYQQATRAQQEIVFWPPCCTTWPSAAPR
jgi:hypothetical protein